MVPGTRVPPMILWFPTREFRGMDLLLPLIHVGLFGSWHHVGSRWASSGVSIWPSLLDKGTRNKECAVTETDKKVSTWVHKLSLRACQFSGTTSSHFRHQHPAFVHIASRWMEKKDKNNAQTSKCNSEYMSWTWFRITETQSRMIHKVAKRPSYSSAARRIPSNPAK